MSARFRHLFVMRPAPIADADISVGETMHAMASDSSIVTATVENKADRGMTLDVRACAWRQEGELDVLTPSHDIRVGPASFVLAPKSKKIVRFAVTAHDVTCECAYQIEFSDREGRTQAALHAFLSPIGASSSLRARDVAEPPLLLKKPRSMVRS